MMRRVNGGAGARVRRLVPALDWGPRYDRAWLRTDVLAGLTVAALVVPKALGYAGIANVPIENGLYAAAAGTMQWAWMSMAFGFPAVSVSPTCLDTSAADM